MVGWACIMSQMGLELFTGKNNGFPFLDIFGCLRLASCKQKKVLLRSGEQSEPSEIVM